MKYDVFTVARLDVERSCHFGGSGNTSDYATKDSDFIQRSYLSLTSTGVGHDVVLNSRDTAVPFTLCKYHAMTERGFLCTCVQAAAAQELDELCFLSAQSMSSLKVSEHFQVVKLLGEGSYGKVMLAVHRKRG